MTQIPLLTDDAVWTIYVRLWGRAEGAGAFVHYDGIVPRGESGWFHPHADQPGRGAEVVIARPFYELQDTPTRGRRDGAAVDLMAELCTLAHEVGHLRSWQKGLRTKKYEDALATFDERMKLAPQPAPLLEKEAHVLITSEEARAWQLGHRELRGLGFTDWPRFDAEEKRALHLYAEILAGGPRAKAG
jgi:hypothetical protein